MLRWIHSLFVLLGHDSPKSQYMDDRDGDGIPD